MSNYDITTNAKTGRIVITGRLLWNSLFQPRKGKGGTPGKYECNVAIPSAASMKVLQDEILAVGKEKFPKAFKDAAGKWPSSVKSPLKKTADNDKLAEIGDGFPLFVAARSKDRPGVAGPDARVEGVEPSMAYPGRWVKMTVDVYGYDTDGNKGVTLGLGNVQLLQDDEELVIGGGRVSAESEFEGVGEEASGKSADAMFG